MIARLIMLVLLLSFVYVNPLNAQSCSCTEYIYLNEVSNGGAVHKYAINADGSVTEVSGANGFPWFESVDWPAGEQLPSPHGLGTDLNGFLYIGETIGGDIRQLNCEGEITFTNEFELLDGGPNIMTYDNILYTNSAANGNSGIINAYDLCTGQSLGSINLSSNPSNWGFFVDDDGTFYSTTNIGVDTERGITIYKPTLADFAASTTYSVMWDLDPNNFDPSVGVIGNVPRGELRGITTDSDGNIYMVLRIRSSTYGAAPPHTICSAIYKYSPTGEILAISTDDCAGDGTGWNYATGIAYSETCDCIYVSTESQDDDCIYRFNKDLTNTGITGSAVGPVPGGQAKGMALNTECCPVPSTGNIDKVLCINSIGERFSLNEAYCGEGIICGADFTPVGTLTGMSFDACSNFITITDDNACGEFIIGGTNSQCGSYNLTVKITAMLPTVPVIQGDQEVCFGADAAPLTVTNSAPGATFQWEQSLDSCDGPWTDIPGATASSYTPTNVAINTFYRVKTVIPSTGCASGSCDTVSSCVTITVSPSPTLTATAPVCATDGSDVYSVAFTSNGTVTASTGTVSGTSITGITVGTDVMLTSTLNGCTTDTTIVSPTCTTYVPRLSKTVDAAAASLGQAVTFTITIYNDGTGELTGVEVTDVLPTGLTYTGDNSGGNYDSGSGLWTIPSIVAGDSAIIEIMATMDVEGVVVNSAEITAADQLGDDPDLTDNQDVACVSVSIECCDSEAINVNLEAPTGYTNYQWYKDGVLIAGANSEMYVATETGSYIYTVDGVGPGDCMGELCCPVIIEQVSCCPPLQCIPITVTKLEE